MPFNRLAIGGGAGKGGGERSALSLCLKAIHLVPCIAHVVNQAGAAITRGITSTVMCHLLIDFAGDSVAVNLLFDKYYGINYDGNGDNGNNNGKEGTTMIGARVLDGHMGCIEVARTGLHCGNRRVSTSLLKGLVFCSSVGKVVAAGVGNGPILLPVDRTWRAVESRLATTLPATAGPSLSSSFSLPLPLPSL